MAKKRHPQCFEPWNIGGSTGTLRCVLRATSALSPYLGRENGSGQGRMRGRYGGRSRGLPARRCLTSATHRYPACSKKKKKESMDAILEKALAGKLASEAEIQELCLCVIQVLLDEPNLLSLSPPITVASLVFVGMMWMVSSAETFTGSFGIL